MADENDEHTPELALIRQKRLADRARGPGKLIPTEGGFWLEGPDAAREITYQHTVLCQASLPYANPGELWEWERSQGAVSLKVYAGEVRQPGAQWIRLGLPFGPKPRLILAYLNSYALRHRTPDIDVGNSLTEFVKDIGLDSHGRNMRTIKDQLARLAAAEIRMAIDYSEEEVRQVNAHIVGEFNLWFPKDERQRVLWPSMVVLDPRYYQSLRDHAVPLDRGALGRLADSAIALDTYAWLAQRLHRIRRNKPAFIPWPALKAQFGVGYGRIRDFRARFQHTLARVLEEYRGAHVEVDDRGMTLRYSLPPIPGRRLRLMIDVTPKKEAEGN